MVLDPSVRTITHSCHRFDASLEHFNRIRAYFEEGPPDLRRLVRKISDTNGKESIALTNGSRLLFKARAKRGGRGFSGQRIILNEAQSLGELGSLIPSMSAQRDPQLLYGGTAPLDLPESDRWRKVIRRGRSGDPTITYREHSAPAESDLDDVDAIAEGNPSLGITITIEFILEVERNDLTDDEFAIERMGIFNDQKDGLPPKITPRHWKLCGTKETEADQPRRKKWMRNPVMLAIAVTPDQEWASIGAAGKCREGGTAVEIVEHRPGVDWVPERAAEILKTHKARGVAIDPRSPAGMLIPDLEKAGIKRPKGKRTGKLIEINTTDHLKAAAYFHTAVKQHTIVHRSEPELDAIVAVATARPVGNDGGWLFTRDADVPSSPLEAAELAVWADHAHAPVDMDSQVH